MDVNNKPVEENARFTVPPPLTALPHRHTGLRYKEKFQALREKFDQVSALHNEYQRDLDHANARVRKLQAENNLLLDAISITVPATPSLMHLIQPSPTGRDTITSYTHPPSMPMNGHAYDLANGRYRDHDRPEMDPVDRSNNSSPFESNLNGRPS